ncbi:MAG: phosphatidate cytidylyltransferase [Elusimicrobia bacterium]|nr:phosphatidate cytidylyltransferase [Candidatus Liberimonas magnetica]
MLLPRLITAIIGIPIVLIAIYWGGIPFFLLMFAVIFLALKEYFMLTTYGGYNNQSIIGTISGLLLFVSMYLNTTNFGPKYFNQGTALLVTVIFVGIFTRELVRKSHEKSIESLAITFFGAFIIPWTLGHLVLIRNLRPTGMLYVFFLFIIIWILDTGAYVFGSHFGRNSLAEKISPKKTLEGAIGGVITAVLIGIISYFIFLKNYFTMRELILVSFLISIIAQFSDLSESLIKRDVGVKDSANLLPGHGGILDRFDSFLFTAPLFYYYLTIFKGN